MDKKFEKICRIANSEGWTLDYSYTDEKETEIMFSFEKYSPAGREYYFEVSVPNVDDETTLLYNVSYAIDMYWEYFDVSYETYIWLDENGHGKNGAPRNMKDVYEDTKSCEKMVHELASSFYNKYIQES